LNRTLQPTQVNAMVAVAACLEGRSDLVVHTLVAESLEASVLRAFAAFVAAFVAENQLGAQPW